MHQPSLLPGNVRRRDRPDKGDARCESRDAGHVRRAALERIRQKIRLAHLLGQTARSSGQQRLRGNPSVERQQNARAHRSVQRLVSRHAHRRKTRIALYVNLCHARRLRRIQDERHACRRQQFRDFVQRRNAAEHVGNVAQYHQIGTVFQRLFQRRNHSRAVPQRRIQHGRLDISSRQRPHDRIVLVTAHNDAGIRFYERIYRNIQRMRGVQRENDSLRLAHAEQRRCLLPAGVHQLSRSTGCRVAASCVACRAVHRTANRLLDRPRLKQGGGSIIQIDHVSPPAARGTAAHQAAAADAQPSPPAARSRAPPIRRIRFVRDAAGARPLPVHPTAPNAAAGRWPRSDCGRSTAHNRP